MRSLANSEPNPELREQLETVASDYDEIAAEIAGKDHRRGVAEGRPWRLSRHR